MSGTSSSTIFNGNSRYSTDFQAIIDRSVSIASLPMGLMTNVKTDLTERSDALSSLESKFASLQLAIQSLSPALGSGSCQATASDSSILSTTVSEGIQEASYALEVTGIGSAANAMSKTPGAGLASVLNPNNGGFEAGSTFKLYINTTDPAAAITITPASGSLNDLVTAINSASSDVRAALVNVGGQSGPDYRLTIQSTHFAADTIQLKDASANDMLDQFSAGSNVKYKINGGAEITNNTRTLQLAPGLSVNLNRQSATGVATTINVSRGTDAMQSALSNFVLSYNNVMTELDLHRGQNSGALTGDSVINSVSNALRQLTSYSANSGTLSSLASLGLSFDREGKLSLDATTFRLNTSGRIHDLADFFGSTTGGGFLQVAADTMDSFEDPTRGILQTGKANLSLEITQQESRIATEQERVDQLKESLTARMAAADALIASMEQQVNYYTSMFESMRAASSSY